MEFGWWTRDPVDGKCQVRASVHGGNITWLRKSGRFTPWEPHSPGAADWEKLVAEAARRVPRRLLSPKQFDAIKEQVPR